MTLNSLKIVTRASNLGCQYTVNGYHPAETLAVDFSNWWSFSKLTELRAVLVSVDMDHSNQEGCSGKVAFYTDHNRYVYRFLGVCIGGNVYIAPENLKQTHRSERIITAKKRRGTPIEWVSLGFEEQCDLEERFEYFQRFGVEDRMYFHDVLARKHYPYAGH